MMSERLHILRSRHSVTFAENRGMCQNLSVIERARTAKASLIHL